MTAADVKPGCGPQPASLTIAPLQGGTRKVYLTYPHSLITQGAFRVLTGDFVTEDAGCGVVHCAPAFGEEDYKVRHHGLGLGLGIGLGVGVGLGLQGARGARHH